MDHFHEDACERVDAAVFSGEMLYTDLEEFKEYLGRWNRAVAEHERLEAEAPQEEKVPCQHKWKQAGFTGPYWAYECEICGEEEFRP